MDPVLIVALVVGAVLPAIVGVVIVLLWMPRGYAGARPMTLAFGKGLVLGVVMGASVSLVVVALVLAGAWWRGR